MNRHSSATWQQGASSAGAEPASSCDGYVRLAFANLRHIEFIHLISGLDEISSVCTSDGAISTEIRGYTEWIGTSSPSVTIGWDWQMDGEHNHILLRKLSAARSNIMLLDGEGKDLGQARTELMLDLLLETMDWSREVQRKIAVRYGMRQSGQDGVGIGTGLGG
jgi:hypothetical protein